MDAPLNPPLRNVSGDLSVWESHELISGKDYYGLTVVCDRLNDPDARPAVNDFDGNKTPAWHTKPITYINGFEVIWADRHLRPIRPAADPRAAENKRILEQQIDRQTSTGVIAC